MADFQSGVQPVQPARMPMMPDPVDTSTGDAITAAGNIFGVIGKTLMNGYQASQQIAGQQQVSRRVGNLEQNLLLTSELDTQGTWRDPNAAMSHVRRLVANSLANATSQDEKDQIYKVVTTFMSTSGLGKNIEQDLTREKDNQNSILMAARQSALADGFIKPGDTPEQMDAGVEAHQEYQVQKQRMENAKKVLELKTAQVGLTNAGLETQSKILGIQGQRVSNARGSLAYKQELAAQDYLSAAQRMQPIIFDRVKSDVAKVVEGVGNGTIKRDDAVAALQKQKASLQASVSGNAVAAKMPGSIEALTKPFDMLIDSAISQVSGATTRANVENTTANIIGLTNLQALTRDPQMLALTSTMKLIPAGASAVQGTLANSAVNLLKADGVIKTDKDGNVVSTPASNLNRVGDTDYNTGIDQYFNIKKRAMKTSMMTHDPELNDEIGTTLNNDLTSFGRYGKNAASVGELSSFIKYVSDPQVYAWIKKNPNAISGNASESATNALELANSKFIVPLLTEQFIDHKVMVSSSLSRLKPYGGSQATMSIPVPDMRNDTGWIDIGWKGTGVRFTAKPQVKGIPAESSVNSEVNRLNAEVAPAITKMIMATAHLDGSNDYPKYYGQFIVTLPMSDAADQKAPQTPHEPTQ